jgi:DMSO/TMAO reductase YedYZ molybdopterin-dependent catalytic subunit
MSTQQSLPPGQLARPDFPRFGLTQYAKRFPVELSGSTLQLTGDALATAPVDVDLTGLPRVSMRADFHCVTTWTAIGLDWEGVRFGDFYRARVEPLIRSDRPARFVLMRGQDGYRSTLPLADLVADDVLLADRLNGQHLGIDHGAPLRLVAPAHYGYKSVKHLNQLAFCWSAPAVRPAALAFMDHPRARVAVEERGRWFPGWLLRLPYRTLIDSTVSRFAQALAARQPLTRSDDIAEPRHD